MSITTQEFVPGTQIGAGEEAVHECFFGLKEVSKGLLGILTGYLIVLGIIGAAIATVVLVVVNVKAGKLAMGDGATIILAMGGALFLAIIFSGWSILRNKWRCLMNAPERGGAKWWMFASMVCVFATPTINFVCGFMDGYSAGQQASRANRMAAFERMTAEKYTESLKTHDTGAYMRLAGAVIGPLGGIFFLLFLRAVAVTIKSWVLARIAEVHLVLDVLLLVGSLYAIFDITRLRFLPHVWLSLALGGLVSFVLWLVLIIGTVVGISNFLGRQRSPLDPSAPATGW
jgi:hypothetical protein